jgi:Skp family chaperone for outer membrane proteins
MIMKKIYVGAAAAALMLAAAAGAQAQTSKKSQATASHTASSSTAAPAAALPPLTHGPVIPGVCVYNNNAAIEGSTVGKAFGERMQQLRAQASAELGSESTSLQNDEKALMAKRASLSQEQLAQQAQPLQQRTEALQQKAETRQRELQATYAKQLRRIDEVVQPLVISSYEAHHCSLLLNGEGVMAANPAMDLSQEVSNALNTKMTTITFDREVAPAQ